MIQSCWRRYKGFCRVQLIREQKRQHRSDLAATQLQRRFRGWLGRIKARTHKEVKTVAASFRAALALQKHFRRKQAIRITESIRYRRQWAKRLGAALVLQCASRRMIARKRRVMAADLQQIDIFVQAKKNNYECVHLLISDEHYDNHIEDTDANGHTVLMVAAMRGHLLTVRKCVELGWSPNATLADGVTTAAHLAAAACMSGQTNMKNTKRSTVKTRTEIEGEEVVMYLIQRGGLDLRVHGETLVLIAAENALRQVLNWIMLADSSICMNARDKKTGQTVLHKAVLSCDRETVSMLLNEVPDMPIDIRDVAGRSPMHLAAMHSSKDVVQHLINCVADLKLKDNKGFTPLLLAALHGSDETAALLRRNWNPENEEEMKVHNWLEDEDIDAVIKIASQGKASVLESAFKLGFSPSLVRWESGDNVAIAACRSADKTCVNLCIKYKADFSHKNNEGKTAIHFAAKRPELLVMLLSDQASGVRKEHLTAPDNYGVTPLMICSSEGGVVDSFIPPPFPPQEVNAKDTNGMTALHYAAREFRIEAVKSLVLKLGASVSEMDNRNNAALHHCANSMDGKLGSLPRDDYSDMVNVLVQHGGNLTIPNLDDLSPPIVALRQGSWRLLEVMCSKLAQKAAQKFAFEFIKYNSRKAMRALLQHCQEYKIHEWRDQNGFSLLASAVKADSVKMVRCLVDEFKAQVPVDLPHIAAFWGAIEVLCYLREGKRLESKHLEKKVNMSSTGIGQGYNGDTVFMAALRGKQIETAWWLWKEYHCKVRSALSAYCMSWIIAIARHESSDFEKNQTSSFTLSSKSRNLNEDSVSLVYFQHISIMSSSF